MATNAEKAYELFQQYIGQEDGVGEWFVVEQQRINAFADATEDHQFIHVDPEQCAQLSPYKVPIAHGFLTLSLLTHLSGAIPTKDNRVYEGIMMGVNYGFEKVRFPNPVKVNSKIRARRVMKSVALKNPNTIQVTHTMTVEIDGEEKPGCVAEWLTQMTYA